MKRLTEKRRDNGQIECTPNCFGMDKCDTESCEIREQLKRLSAYEDTGLEPEEIIALREWKTQIEQYGREMALKMLDESAKELKAPMAQKLNFLAKEEFERSMKKFPLFASQHEGYAVILEEVEELREETEIQADTMKTLWAYIRHNNQFSAVPIARLRQAALHAAAEAVQVVAMCDKWDKSFPGEVQAHEKD